MTEHLELLLASVNFQMVSVLQAIEVQHQYSILCNRCPEFIKLELFIPCCLVPESSEDLCHLLFLH